MEGGWRCVSKSILRHSLINKMPPAGHPEFVPRVLDVQKGRLCYVIGTVYMEMPLKPNVLDDIAQDVCT
jgi:hypothetical protein